MGRTCQLFSWGQWDLVKMEPSRMRWGDLFFMGVDPKLFSLCLQFLCLKHAVLRTAQSHEPCTGAAWRAVLDP